LKFTKKISKTFFVFLILSLLIWLLITFSKEYVAQVSLTIAYDELPQDQRFQKAPENTLQIIARGTGFKLLSTRLFNHHVQLKSSNLTKKDKSRYFFLTSSQKVHVQKQLVSGLRLDEFVKDTIYLEIGQLVSKKVPVISNLKIDYQIGYDALKPIEINPDSILVSGPKAQMKDLNELTFEQISLENVSANFSQKALIKVEKNLKNIKYNVTEVVVNGFVEKFTEGSLTIPFTVKNRPENLNLTTFPKEVKVVFKVDLPSFKTVDQNSFTVVCDYSVSEANGFLYLIPKIISQPNFVKNVKIIPNKIEYLIQK
jgi:hypothetical protein